MILAGLPKPLFDSCRGGCDGGYRIGTCVHRLGRHPKFLPIDLEICLRKQKPVVHSGSKRTRQFIRLDKEVDRCSPITQPEIRLRCCARQVVSQEYLGLGAMRRRCAEIEALDGGRCGKRTTTERW